ncbi:MAG: MBL fold metallo-hydrolase [Gammaproteobacteria bacterium]|nr:MBL fold metallo-hydrolase [Gammaproteobacteria bacterium]NNM01106.1 MBL fold metallo-hydrolase [Gammaproteobacteria bacterium]
MHVALAACIGTLLTAAVHADAPWDPAAVVLEAREMGEGVYAVLPADAFTRDHVGTTAGFVVGERDVLLVETLVNRKLTEALLALVRSTTDKPIRYVVNSSYHGDHSYGNSLLPDDVIVIQHPATAAYIGSAFMQDRAFMIDLMGPGKGIEEVQPRAADLLVDGLLTIDLGGRRVEIRHFGFAQTPGDLVIWVPEAEVLWVGNMVQAAPPAIPWLLEGRHTETIATLEAVRAFLPETATIIPGHGKPMPGSGIDYSLDYLRQLDALVRQAVVHGRTLEEVRAGAVLTGFDDYSLYAFAHGDVNVPMVYKTVSEAR